MSSNEDVFVYTGEGYHWFYTETLLSALCLRSSYWTLGLLRKKSNTICDFFAWPENTIRENKLKNWLGILHTVNDEGRGGLSSLNQDGPSGQNKQEFLRFCKNKQVRYIYSSCTIFSGIQ